MEENLKKALLELLVLALLYERDNHVPELTAALPMDGGGNTSASPKLAGPISGRFWASIETLPGASIA